MLISEESIASNTPKKIFDSLRATPPPNRIVNLSGRTCSGRCKQLIGGPHREGSVIGASPRQRIVSKHYGRGCRARMRFTIMVGRRD